MKTTHALTIGVVTWLLAGSTAFADVQLTMQNGRVSLVAKDATLRQILIEWARVGQTKIVNVERVPGGPMSLELNNMPEAQALDVLLRTLSGYMAAPRPVPAANLSQFDRIIVMPTSAAPRTAASSAPPTAPTFQQPQFNQPPSRERADDDGDDERPAPNGQMPNPNRGPVFNTFPQPMVVNPQGVNGMPVIGGGFPQGGAVPQTAQPAAFPTAPFGGVAVPGMVAPAPPPAPGQPGVVGQPVRRPGGPGGQ